MKVFVFVSFLVALVATCLSSPADPRLVDWAAVASKASEIEDTMSNAARDIYALASNENAVVGAAVEMKMQMAAQEASMVRDRVNQAIEAQTLTEGEVRALVGELRGIMSRLRGSIERDIAMLTPMTAAQIRAVFDATNIAVGMRANELAALLRQ